MIAALVPARLGHVLRVARRLDPEMLALAAARNIDARRLLRDCFAESREAWALLCDGRAVAVGGWRGTLLCGEAEVWLSVTAQARQCRFALTRAAARQARTLLDRGMTIIAWTLDGDRTGCRFAEWCGLIHTAQERGMHRHELIPESRWTL